jgi:ubiquinone/menaquinone biosynthesis C-methylase UbiE
MSTKAINPFDPIAKEYDQWFDDNKNMFHSELEAVRIFLPKQGRGTEIGVGTGRFAKELGIEYGIEPSESMAIFARDRGIKVTIATAENLPYDDESFDYAIMVTVDPFVDDIEKVYREIFRILKTGGKLIVGTLHKEGEIAQKYSGMIDNGFYKNARFHSVPETLQQLQSNGFTKFNTCQTLANQQPETIEMPIMGYDKGSFVAIEALKTN